MVAGNLNVPGGVVHVGCQLVPGLHDPLNDEVGLDDAGGLGHLLQEGQREVLALLGVDGHLGEEVGVHAHL